VTLADSSPIETAVATVHSLAGKAYLPRLTVGGYLNLVEERFPELAPLLDFERPGTARALDELCGFVNEFETDDDGRGGSYRRARHSGGCSTCSAATACSHRCAGRSPRRRTTP